MTFFHMSRKRFKNYCCDKQALCVRLKISLWSYSCGASRCAKFDTENKLRKCIHTQHRKASRHLQRSQTFCERILEFRSA